MKPAGCHICKDHLDRDRITDAVTLAGPAANDPVPLFFEMIIIVNEA